jgi:hypothetical protein
VVLCELRRSFGELQDFELQREDSAVFVPNVYCRIHGEGNASPFFYFPSECIVEMTFKKFEVMWKAFQIYDNLNRLVYCTDVMVSAETTALEFSYENYLNYGDIKGAKSHKIFFKIMNKGRYEILCR